MSLKNGEIRSGFVLVQMDLSRGRDRCLPLAKARSMSKAERAATAKKKKREGGSRKQFVSNTTRGRVTKKYTKRGK